MTAENKLGPELVNLMKDGYSLVSYDLPMFDRTYIKYTPEKIASFEDKAKADFRKDEDTIMVSVPLFEDKNSPINPIRITYFPSTESDTLPTNRAIAEIGNVLEYWKNFAIQMKTGEFRFFDLKATSLLPVFTDNNGNHFLLSKEKHKGHALFNETPYKNCIFAINYAGDGNFMGTNHPETDIVFRAIDGMYHNMPINEIGLTSAIMSKIFTTSKSIWSSRNIESTKYIKSNYNSFPTEIRTMIDETATCRSALTYFDIWNAYFFKKHHTDYAFLDNALVDIGKAVDAEFAKNINGSETLNAVDEYVKALEEMYQEALPQYQR